MVESALPMTRNNSACNRNEERMRNAWLVTAGVVVVMMTGLSKRGEGQRQSAVMSEEAACEVLAEMANVTVTSATLRPAMNGVPEHCYIRGTVGGGRIRFNMQLPTRNAWNGRLVNLGDGGKDGALGISNQRVSQGYVTANSNSGHDSGSEPNASFGTNLDAVMDFGYRAVHLTANVSKTVTRAFYGRNPAFSYFEGCSTGGRQGLMEAQRFPQDFDGIVAGDPVFDYERVNIAHIWLAKRVLENRGSGNLVFDKDGDGTPESLTKVRMLSDRVLSGCDDRDGVADGLIEDPYDCDFTPARDLANYMCKDDRDEDDCFTKAQLKTIEEFYRGPYDSKGRLIRKGFALGSEYDWPSTRLATKANNMTPGNLGVGADQVNYLFYRDSPGVPPDVMTDLTAALDKTSFPPQFGWWEFNFDDVADGKGAFMAAILEATNPSMARYLKGRNGKLLLYHGLGDTTVSPAPTLDYYQEMVRVTFGGDLDTARKSARLFLVPGMSHCSGGPGCDSWDRLAPLVQWVEKQVEPEYLIGRHFTNGVQDNERRLCAYPQKAFYVGPPDAGSRSNWLAANFACR